MEQQTGFKLGKEYVKAVYCHPAYLTYMQSTSWEIPGWMNQSWNQDCWEKCQQLQICRYHSNGRKQRGTEEPLDEGKREEWKSWLKARHSKTKIMATSPINSWQIDGEKMETMADFIFLGSKITADSDCSHEIKRHLLLGRKVMTNLDSILKIRDVTLPTKVCLVKAMVFPIVMCECESWII